ncbi:GtrA-like protein [Corynebacterium gottingense]|nr:GtrA-like protein [Corynebacterium gottingense]WJZ15148.1 GtrA-like protein [Corynebacterium gottingense]
MNSSATTERMANGLREFIKFGLVGGSGVVVNLAVFYVAKKSLEAGLDLHEADALMSIPGTRFNIRWYHLLSTLAFVIANVWNYQLNRSWTFRKIEQRNWFAGFFPFLATGAIAFLVSLTFMTLFMNPTSPIALPDHIFDDSSGLRTKSYWAQGLSTIIATPVNFIINKFWAFAKPKPSAPHAGEET